MYIYVLHTGYRGTYEPTCNPFACKKFACCAPPRHFYYYYKVHVPTLACRPHAAPLSRGGWFIRTISFIEKPSLPSQFFPLFLLPFLPYFTLKTRYDIGKRGLPPARRKNKRHEAIKLLVSRASVYFPPIATVPPSSLPTFGFLPGSNRVCSRDGI